MAQLNVELVAADGKVWEGQARQVVARGIEGDFGILPGHEPFLTVLAEGEVRIDGEGGGIRARIDSGFLSVDADRVTVVAETVDTSARA